MYKNIIPKQNIIIYLIKTNCYLLENIYIIYFLHSYLTNFILRLDVSAH